MSGAVATVLDWGRANRRVPVRLAFVLFSLAGLWLVAQGAIIPAKAALAQVLLDRAFDRSVAEGAPIKAWPWADAAPVARITVPRLGASDVLLSGGSGEAMAFGPTLSTAEMNLDRRGTTVFSAHRDTHFRYLRDLRRGDVVVVESIDGRRASYAVTGANIVRHDRFALDPHASPTLIVLATCWPFDANQRGPLRYVVTARRVS